MDTASSHLIYRGIDPLLRSSYSHRHNNLPLRRHSKRISAVATDPKPAPVTTVNGSSSRSPPTKPVNGVSQ
ncbi:ABC1 family protein, partial [Trifolium medium]|nr:ABC1 family protein [Trifolium medium]